MTAPTNDKIVSIVDDEIDVTELFHDALCNNIDGITIVTFNDPVIALEHFTDNKENYALVISDLRMPNLNGLELLKKIKKLNEKVRTTLISAHDVENDVVFQHYIELGIIDSFIPKPVTINQLCQKVRDEFLVYQLAVNLK
ncbi:MAG: response regulator [Nitrososphaerota archaeon]|jgi:sigma-B regulation protein RsbU (phosphoserine phosphatase)|nr:response regulator [Nitrososphaeraceae archaeon]